MIENTWSVLNLIGNTPFDIGVFVFKLKYVFYLSIILGVLRLFLYRTFGSVSSNGVETKGNSKLNSKAFKKNRGDTR